MYKSRFDGFEFWTGRSWVSNKNMYKKLCEKDSSIESILDLNSYQKEYFNLIKGEK